MSRQERGIALIVVAAMMVVAVATLGLGVDLSRVVLVKQAVQGQMEAAALAAAMALDGTENGPVRAWGEASKIRGTTIAYSEASEGPWQPFAGDPVRTRCVKLSNDLVVPLTMMRVVVQRESLPMQMVLVACQSKPGAAELIH